MSEFIFSNEIKKNEDLRKSFNQLATDTFGINFENWYKKGYWTEKYVPYVFIDEGKIVANVSINKIKLLIKGQTKDAIQIGTVMTHPNYRNQGLSARLMNKVIEEYNEKVDFMYLFANQSVLEFYPRFGFKKMDETLFTTTFTSNQNKSTNIYKFNCSKKDHLDFIYKFVTERLPVSQIFGTVDTPELFMFYCLYVFNENTYYLEQEEAIVIFEHEGKKLTLFDIVSKKDYCLENILNKIVKNQTSVVHFQFTPDDKNLDYQRTKFQSNETLFIRTKGTTTFPREFKHPLTSQA